MKLNEKDIEKGYWYFRPNENFPPKGKLLAEYNGETLLNLTIAKRDENNGQRKTIHLKFQES